MAPRRRVYLASPLGFSESTRAFREELHQLLEALELDVVDPWDAAPFPPATTKTALLIGRFNFQEIKSADLVLAILDGADVDSGTACEIGYAAALGIPVFGLRLDIRASGECPELPVNLQVATACLDSGGLLRSLEELPSILDAPRFFAPSQIPSEAA